jgi:hypothetical protein
LRGLHARLRIARLRLTVARLTVPRLRLLAVTRLSGLTVARLTGLSVSRLSRLAIARLSGLRHVSGLTRLRLLRTGRRRRLRALIFFVAARDDRERCDETDSE